MTEHQTIEIGRQAADVLENEAYKIAMKNLREQVVSQWKECPIRDREGQMLFLQLAKLTDKFEGLLKGQIESAKFAQHKIDIDNLRDESKLRRSLRKVIG